MDHPIKRDHARFKKIVKGKLRDNLRKYISEGQQIIPKGSDQFKIPMPSIDIPRFKFGDKSEGGSGQGEGRRSELGCGAGGSGRAGAGLRGRHL